MVSNLLCVCLFSAVAAMASSMPGGLTGDKPITPAVAKIVSSVSNEAVSKIQYRCKQLQSSNQQNLGCERGDFKIEPLSYKSQVVAGTNYFVKVRVSGSDYSGIWHIRIYDRPWDKTRQLTSVTGPKEETDGIEYF